VYLLDVGRDPRLVGCALQERGLDLGALDSLLDVVDEQVGHRVLVAEEEILGQVVVRVDAGAGDDLQPGLLRDAPRETHVATAEHRGGLGDRLDATLDHGARRLESRLERPVLVDGLGRNGFPDRARVRPLGQDRLVAEDQMLMDERGPELLGIDRPGDGLDRRHGDATYPMRVPRTWAIAMTILILCLLASIVIALVRLV
jgi:hypothetical protein